MRSQVFDAGDLSGRADQVLRAIALDVAGADVLVVARDGGEHVVERQIVGQQPLRTRRNDERLLVAADGVDFDRAGRLTQLRTNDPVLRRSQVRRRPLRSFVRRHRVHEDLAEAGRDRARCRLESARQLRAHFRDPLGDELTREVDVGAVLEHDRDLRQAVARQRARVVQVRQSGHRGFDGKRDALLGFERRDSPAPRC